MHSKRWNCSPFSVSWSWMRHIGGHVPPQDFCIDSRPQGWSLAETRAEHQCGRWQWRDFCTNSGVWSWSPARPNAWQQRWGGWWEKWQQHGVSLPPPPSALMHHLWLELLHFGVFYWGKIDHASISWGFYLGGFFFNFSKVSIRPLFPFIQHPGLTSGVLMKHRTLCPNNLIKIDVPILNELHLHWFMLA